MRRIVALERDAGPVVVRRIQDAERAALAALSDDELDHRIGQYEQLAELLAPAYLDGVPMTAEREEAIAQASAVCESFVLPGGIASSARTAAMPDDEVDGAIRGHLAEWRRDQERARGAA